MAVYSFIKLSRKILHWKWYKDENTFRVWINLLLRASIKDRKFKTTNLHRGEAIISLNDLADDLGVSKQEARTAIMHLKQTGEIETFKRNGYTIIKISKYDEYQSSIEQEQKKPNKAEKQEEYDPFNPFSNETAEEREERIRLLRR